MICVCCIDCSNLDERRRSLFNGSILRWTRAVGSSFWLDSTNCLLIGDCQFIGQDRLVSALSVLGKICLSRGVALDVGYCTLEDLARCAFIR